MEGEKLEMEVGIPVDDEAIVSVGCCDGSVDSVGSVSSISVSVSASPINNNRRCSWVGG